MRNIIRKYRELSFEQKTVYKTIIGLCFSAALACGKLVIGLFTDYNLISIRFSGKSFTMARKRVTMERKKKFAEYEEQR